MRISRKLLNLRFLIYAGLIAFFGYEAIERYRGAAAEGQAPPEAGNAGGDELQPTRVQLLPDGTKVPIYEITPEQAERLLGAPPQEKAPAKPDPAAPGEPKPDTPD